MFLRKILGILGKILGMMLKIDLTHRIMIKDKEEDHNLYKKTNK